MEHSNEQKTLPMNIWNKGNEQHTLPMNIWDIGNEVSHNNNHCIHDSTIIHKHLLINHK